MTGNLRLNKSLAPNPMKYGMLNWKNVIENPVLPILKLNYSIFCKLQKYIFAWRHVLRLGIDSNHMRLHFRVLVFLSFFKKFLWRQIFCNCIRTKLYKTLSLLIWFGFGCGLCLQHRVSEKHLGFARINIPLTSKLGSTILISKAFVAMCTLIFL